MWITFICFFLAGPALFFNYKSEGLGGSILIIAPIIVSAFFVFMFYHFLRTIIIGDTSITIRPSFLYLANWKFADVSINYEDISNVEVARDNQKNSIWISIYLWTKDGKKTKLNYGLHNSEVGEALYIFLKDKIGQLSETEKEQLIARGVAME
ncbi:MAG: hypothetical protein A3A24_03635 [Candidatus Buchananbacteria bacterium RIFCSPLOWO2_01_FULL_46_12]|uniref:DUF5673 domain-containing protein n=1 Tax=Candidatus Buchananbacteria bacterium RIFCSPLOWO2_01_FULL_46_12 TaxID=1797546 RepID=A0A1G1YRR9_9BACT|nr:MAG: hypothetical protein A3A24_03635 [Candidatus Buchananbacteria bacterium RIFCSPLOWO2_01_FULL_46_12]